jgi:hypothetical protein
MSCGAGGAQRRSWCGGWGRPLAAAAAPACQRHPPHRSLASASPATLITNSAVSFKLNRYIKTFCASRLYSTVYIFGLFCIKFFVSFPNKFFRLNLLYIFRFRTKKQFFSLPKKNCLFFLPFFVSPPKKRFYS